MLNYQLLFKNEEIQSYQWNLEEKIYKQRDIYNWFSIDSFEFIYSGHRKSPDYHKKLWFLNENFFYLNDVLYFGE